MLRELLKTPRALVYAIIGHVLLVLVLLISLDFAPTVPSASNNAPLKAVAVDEAQVKQDMAAIKRRQSEQEKRKLDAEKQTAEAEKKRKKEEQRLKETQQKLAEQSRLQAEEKKRLDKLAEQRKQEEQRQKDEKIKQQKAKEATAAAEREAELKKQLAQEEAQRQLAEQQRQAAQNNKHLDSLRARWIAAIKTKIENNWLKPAHSGQVNCVVKVHIDPAGYVLRVDVSRCLADEAYRASVERAVYKASPLPKPEDPSIFDRDIELTVTDKKSQ